MYATLITARYFGVFFYASKLLLFMRKSKFVAPQKKTFKRLKFQIFLIRDVEALFLSRESSLLEINLTQERSILGLGNRMRLEKMNFFTEGKCKKSKGLQSKLFWRHFFLLIKFCFLIIIILFSLIFFLFLCFFLWFLKF